MHPDLLSDSLHRSNRALRELTDACHPELAAAERAYREHWAARVSPESVITFDRVPCLCDEPGCATTYLEATITWTAQ